MREAARAEAAVQQEKGDAETTTCEERGEGRGGSRLTLSGREEREERGILAPEF